ncbi:MAG: protein kinase domain-containing protein [Elusimicrobiota bacterium]
MRDLICALCLLGVGARPALSAADAAALLDKASWAMAALEYGEAYTLATQAIRADPSNPKAWNLRAVADNKLGRYEKSIEDSAIALRLLPGNPAVLLNQSWALCRLGRYAQALKDAQAVLKKNPRESFAYQDAAMALAGMNRKGEALKSLRRAAELNPQFQALYVEADHAVSGQDILAILNREKSQNERADGKTGQRPSFLGISILTMSGGLLIAFGIMSFWPSLQDNRGLKSGRKPPLKQPEKIAGSELEVLPKPYDLIKPIGSSPIGLSYQARDASLGRLVTIKKMRREIRSDPAERERFLKEARTIALLRHPNIPDIYRVIEQGEDVFLILEWFDGAPLTDLLKRRGPLDYSKACGVLRQACAATDYAHGKGVAHRALSLETIAVSENGAVKIKDFGLAAAAQESLMRTQSWTPGPISPYAAPEEEAGRACPQSDIFSLAVCFYEMVSGKKPFRGEGQVLSLNKSAGLFLPIAHENAALPKQFDDAMRKALAPDARLRPQTAGELCAMIESLLYNVG